MGGLDTVGLVVYLVAFVVGGVDCTRGSCVMSAVEAGAPEKAGNRHCGRLLFVI
jgi:hypothetical protein